MTLDHPRPKVGLLALTLEFYETLAPALREGREQWVRREVLPALEPLADVTFDRAVYRRENVEAAVAALEQAGAEALLVMLLTYSPSQIALPALKRTALPVVIWNTQELFAVDESFEVEAMIANHGVHGTQHGRHHRGDRLARPTRDGPLEAQEHKDRHEHEQRTNEPSPAIEHRGHSVSKTPRGQNASSSLKL